MQSSNVPPSRFVTRAVLAMLLGLVACLTAYLAITVPRDWFPGSSPRAFDASALAISRGTGTLVNDELQVTAADDSGVILISQATDLKATDYAAIAWSCRW